MLRKAFFRAFFFLLLMAALANPAFAFYEGGDYRGAPSDSQAPRSNGMQWFVRRVPVLLYTPENMSVSLDSNKGEINLSDVDLVWGELWTKPGWVKEGNRYGLNELYIPINSNMAPAPVSGRKKVILPDADFDNPDVLSFLADYFDVYAQTRLIDKNNTWAGDASSGLYVNIPLPSRQDFLSQEEGMNEVQAAKWKPFLASQAYPDGLIPSADGSKQYLRALDAFNHGSTFYYHLLLNPGPQTGNWQVAAQTSPNYDENAPDGTGFYRGKDWSDQLKSNPAAVPGFIGAITPWANLKLEGPVEITGAPGEEKEAQYTITNESSAVLAPDVAVKREGGAYVTAAAEVPVKAWDKAPVTLKFKVEDTPYKVRVAVNPFGGLLESTYKDNYVDVTVKPILPSPPVDNQGGGSSGGGGNAGGRDYNGSGELVFYARSRGGQDIYGNYKPPEDRPVNTAKYADIVKAVLKPAPLTPPQGTLVSWKVTSATLSYPKRNPEFTFGHPTMEPVGTITVSMTPNDHEATVEFEEDWSVAGAPIYDMLAGRDAPPPTEYTITAEYTVEYEYEYTECDKDGCYTVRAKGTASGTASGSLLVNGTGINIL
ncbi:hypothetical protein MGLY_27760 [Neomoorella glycerini]|uniref:CARDB domain-containing protein n=1 Tax=Neomoorella glycerini TaxID=55779 RepID=A0A6I5ZUI1_9FIRM|nr:hypothetical protein [Moorella glycerini]QGP93368.1 hypothetical protein MGLY_27760 [Moorella glycerini]